MKNALGDRMKNNYENRTRFFLPRRTYSILRVDGRAFHTLTKKMNKPFDPTLMLAMDETAIQLCKEIAGAKFAYVQSDEISILICDFDRVETGAWFDGNIQKISSVSASIATAAFNSKYARLGNADADLPHPATFDARVFSITDPIEVENYFVWRFKDAFRNSIQSIAQDKYTQKELNGKRTSDLIKLCDKEISECGCYELYGRIVTKNNVGWSANGSYHFVEDRQSLSRLVPRIWFMDYAQYERKVFQEISGRDVQTGRFQCTVPNISEPPKVK